MHKIAVSLVLLAYSSPSVSVAEDRPAVEYSKMEDKIQIGFLMRGLVYSAERNAIVERKTRSAYVNLRLWEAPLIPTASHAGPRCLELKDRRLAINPAALLRWRLSPSSYLWGTECTLNDYYSGVFRIPLGIIRPLDTEDAKAKDKWVGRGWLVDGKSRLSNFSGGDAVIGGLAGKYEREKTGGRGGGRADGGGPFEGWYREMDGIYFDFVPKKDENWISLFVLFNSERLKFSNDPTRAAAKNALEIWDCDKGRVDRVFKDGTYDGSKCLWRGDMFDLDENGIPFFQRELADKRIEPKHAFKGWFSTDMCEPFYMFQTKDDYFFTTITGKIYIAPQVPVEYEKIDALIAELDSEVFAAREKATEDLRAMGKAAQQDLESRLSKEPISAEQKRRITRLVGELKRLPDRETKLLWQDEKRPVEKLLFDQDKDKVYAFTKPDQEKRVWLFEVAAKPEVRLFTGKENPDTPAGVPASARTLVEYARFVRKEK